jgi:hypothetical protein
LHTFTGNISAKIDAFSLRSNAIRNVKKREKKGKIYDKCINELIIQRAHLLCYFINFINIYDPLLSSSYVKISSLKCKKRKVKSLAAALGNKI